MPRVGKKPLPPHALALLYLRSARDCSQRDLADRMGWADEKMVSRYERGAKPLSRKTLDACAEALGYPLEAVDLLLLVDSWIEAGEEEPSLPEPLSPEVLRWIERSGLTLASSFLDGWRAELVRAALSLKAEMARRKAPELWNRLKSATRQERREAVAALPELQSWALAELVCHESEKAAAHKVEIALDLADLALYIAGRVPGDEIWRSRLEGYCWAYIANARRVANELERADATFARAWELWRTGATGGFLILAEWRLLDREASLRRDQQRFPESLELLEKARDASKGDPVATARILLNQENIYEQMGDIQGAFTALKEVAPIIKSLGDARLRFAHLFKTANNLCHLRRYQEAAEQLSQVRELAIEQGNELDLIRVSWLQARVAAGQERKDDAIAGLEQVRQELTARGLPHDAALASLELAVLYLEEERTADVRNLARAMSWIFQAQGIAREALAALTLFFEAAQRETATVELTRRVTAELERTRASAPQKQSKGGRG
ncbi:MAG TPA: helix-turn-helix transcriptional regulator [Thermoanaerobaculia bacterium]|nr:helix-turn-helix transcriptional regulator [Thermoanaerobaculia bacterium]